MRAAARTWTARGVGPFVVLDHVEVNRARLSGQPASFDHSAAFSQLGGLMLELFCVHHDSPVTQASGLHHLAFFVESVDEAGARLTDHGWPEVLAGSSGGGNYFAMHDARSELGHLVEIYTANERMLAFYASIAGNSIASSTTSQPAWCDHNRSARSSTIEGGSSLGIEMMARSAPAASRVATKSSTEAVWEP